MEKKNIKLIIVTIAVGGRLYGIFTLWVILKLVSKGLLVTIKVPRGCGC